MQLRKKNDFHGMTSEEALKVVENIINFTRCNKDQYSLTLVTGNGKIKKLLIDLFIKLDIEFIESLSNSGIINVYID